MKKILKTILIVGIVYAAIAALSKLFSDNSEQGD
jgi:hypothetical protein